MRVYDTHTPVYRQGENRKNKFFSSSLGLFLTVARFAPTRGSTATVTELNEDPGCEGRTTSVYATITPGTCAENDKADHCTTENGWGLLSSEYTFCEFDQAAYLQYAFATSYYVLVEFYWDTPCENLWHTVVLLADGQCHQTVQETIMVTTDAEGTLYLQNRGLDCDRGLWGNPVPKAMVNSGECFVGKDVSKKVYLVDGTAAVSSSASSSASSSSTKTNMNTNTTDTTTANTTTSSPATSILHTMPYASVFTALTVAGALAAMC